MGTAAKGTGTKRDLAAIETTPRNHRMAARIAIARPRLQHDELLRNVLTLMHGGAEVRRTELRDALVMLRRWSYRYAHARFSKSATLATNRDLRDVADDAAQHLAIALIKRYRAPREMPSEYAVAWCKRVIANFVISEQRRRARVTSLPAPPEDSSVLAERAVATREAFGVFIRALRSEVERMPAHRDNVARLALFDEFLESFWGESLVIRDRHARNRFEQRRSRGRRLAREAWSRLRAQQSGQSDLREFACALGLEAETEQAEPA